MSMIRENFNLNREIQMTSRYIEPWFCKTFFAFLLDKTIAILDKKS